MNKETKIFTKTLEKLGIEFTKINEYQISIETIHNFYPTTKIYVNSTTGKTLTYNNSILLNTTAFDDFLNPVTTPIKDNAKAFVNLIYQPTSLLKVNESSDNLWEWSKVISIKVVDSFITYMQINALDYSYYQSLKTEIQKL